MKKNRKMFMHLCFLMVFTDICVVFRYKIEILQIFEGGAE